MVRPFGDQLSRGALSKIEQTQKTKKKRLKTFLNRKKQKKTKKIRLQAVRGDDYLQRRGVSKSAHLESARGLSQNYAHHRRENYIRAYGVRTPG